MSWVFHAEEICRPREPASEIFAAIDKSAEGEMRRMPNLYAGFEVDGHIDQIKKAAALAKEMVKIHETNFPTGCMVTVDCDGHIGNENLNLKSRHTSVRVFVKPVPFHR